MTPIYASDRIDLSGWYAFQEPEGDLVLWDGGANRQTNESTVGLWCPLSGTPLPRPAEFLNRIPQMPMYGWLNDDDFTVMDFPHVEQALNMTGRRTDNPVFYMVEDNGDPLRFFNSAMQADGVFSSVKDCPCRFVGCRILPEDKTESLRLAREMGPDTIVRHPMSAWTRQRNPLYASILGPPATPARVREIKLVDGHVDEVTCWTTPETLVTVFPLYEGDQFPDNNAFVPTSHINLYIVQGTVIGYD